MLLTPQNPGFNPRIEYRHNTSLDHKIIVVNETCDNGVASSQEINTKIKSETLALSYFFSIPFHQLLFHKKIHPKL